MDSGKLLAQSKRKDKMFKMYGVVPPMITPFTADGTVDEDGLRRLVAYLSDKVDGLFICGSYGSGPMMSLEERKRVAEITVKTVDGKIPVVTHTGTTNTRDTIELSRHAADIGCAAVSAVGPYYFKHNEDNLLAFYSALVESVGPDYPAYVYHNPQFSGYEIAPATMKKLIDLGIRGIKDATFNIMTFASYMRELAVDGCDVVLGTESMWLSARALGAEAFIPGLGNAFPELCREMHRSGMRDDLPTCREVQFKVNRLREIMYLAKSTQLAIYAMLEIRGILKTYPRSPFVPASFEQKEGIRKALTEMEVL